MKTLLAAGLWLAASLAYGESLLPLSQVLTLAQDFDPWQVASQHRQQALEDGGEAAATWADPQMSLALMNLPTDSFDFRQEAMTQVLVGVSQALPRGNSHRLKQQQHQALGQQQVFMRKNRQAQLAVTVTQLWLDIWLAQQSIKLIQQDRGLFENLVDVAQANYATALGRARQQDLVRAQLELVRLDDRLETLRTRRDEARAKLNQWLPERAGFQFLSGPFEVPEALPLITVTEPELLQLADRNALARRLQGHPLLQNFDQAISAEQSGVDIARQNYKPQWALSASYGYRQDDLLGRERADFFSAGVSFDLPLFTARRQDKQLSAAKLKVNALETDKVLALRQLVARFENQRQILLRMNQRQALYQQQLLEQSQDQAEAALTAYTNDDGDFAEVVRARIAEINTRIEALSIQVERLKTIANINYFMVHSQGASTGGDNSQ